MTSIASHPAVEIVALCDIDTTRAGKARKAMPGAKFYQDRRELLAREKIDSVNVSTPGNIHRTNCGRSSAGATGRSRAP